MKEIAISEFKTKCFALLERVRKTREPIVITRYGIPIARVVPASVHDRSAWIGSMKDSIEIVGDIISPANEESEWEVLRN